MWGVSGTGTWGVLLILVLVVLSVDSVMNQYKVNNRIKKSAKYPLYIAGLFPMSNNTVKGRVGLGVLPAVKQAIHDINKNNSILSNYVLHIDAKDTKCDTGNGMKVFFDFMYNLPRKIILFGDVCTIVTDPVAKASKHWSVVQLSYGDTHPMYSNKMYPNLFRIVPSENEFNAPRIKLLQLYNWTRVGTLYQNTPLYSLAHNKLLKEIEEFDGKNNTFVVVESQSFVDGIIYQMKKLRDSKVRIILGNFNETWARRIFCEAYKEKMFGKHYQWLIVAAYDITWWRMSGDTNCTLSEIEMALKGTILMDFLPLSTSDDITISGRTSHQYKEIYESISLGIQSRFHGYSYDGIWAIGLALNNLLKSKNNSSYLTTFDYKIKKWEMDLLDSLSVIEFMGVTGPVQFVDNGRKGSVLIKQFQEFHTVNTEVKIGEYNSVSHIMNLTKYFPEKIKWNNRMNEPPKDRTVLLTEHTRINLSIFIVFTFISSVGILASIFFLVINIKFRNQRYIKMSSPYLNNLIIIGCIFAYTSIIILGLDSELTSVEMYPYICTARAWILMAGFTLAFGSMFSKTWRVHSIFTNVKINKKIIKDMKLFLLVSILFAIDLIIMISWQLLDPFYRETKNMAKYVHPQNDNIEIIPIMEFCKSDYMNIFIGFIYTYKGLLMAFGCFLAWETRHVSIPALNDSKYIGMSVYNSVMMCIIGAPLSHVLSDKQDVSFVIISIFIIFCTSGTLCLVFLPKVIELKRNPKGTIDKKLRTTIKPTFSSSGGGHNRRQSATSLYEHEFKTAKQINTKYRKQIREIDNEIQALVKILGKEGEEIIRAMDSLTLPKSDLFKKEDTDVSSLYSLNSEGGEEVFIEPGSPEKKPLKYPGLFQQPPLWEGIANTMINSTKTMFQQKQEIFQTKLNEEVTQQNLINLLEPKLKLKLLSKPTTLAKIKLYKSEVNLTKNDVNNQLLPKKSSSDSYLNSILVDFNFVNQQKTGTTPQQGNRRTTQEDIWLMLQKERRYIDTNIFKSETNINKIQPEQQQLRRKSIQPLSNRNIKSNVKPVNKKLKSPTIAKFNNTRLQLHKFNEGNEFRRGPGSGDEVLNISSSTTQINIQQPKRAMRSESIEVIPKELGQEAKLSKYKSYSVPKYLDSSEILNVKMLPIFHKILNERQRSLKYKTEEFAQIKNKNKLMVSCPNIMIKCDIVEYL